MGTFFKYEWHGRRVTSLNLIYGSLSKLCHLDYMAFLYFFREMRLKWILFFQKSLTCSGFTVGKIYTPIIWFFQNKVVNIASLELEPVSDERPGLRQVRDINSWYWQLFSEKTKMLMYRFYRLYSCIQKIRHR